VDLFSNLFGFLRSAFGFLNKEDSDPEITKHKGWVAKSLVFMIIVLTIVFACNLTFGWQFGAKFINSIGNFFSANAENEPTPMFSALYCRNSVIPPDVVEHDNIAIIELYYENYDQSLGQLKVQIQAFNSAGEIIGYTTNPVWIVSDTRLENVTILLLQGYSKSDIASSEMLISSENGFSVIKQRCNSYSDSIWVGNDQTINTEDNPVIEECVSEVTEIALAGQREGFQMRAGEVGIPATSCVTLAVYLSLGDPIGMLKVDAWEGARHNFDYIKDKGRVFYFPVDDTGSAIALWLTQNLGQIALEMGIDPTEYRQVVFRGVPGLDENGIMNLADLPTAVSVENPVEVEVEKEPDQRNEVVTVDGQEVGHKFLLNAVEPQTVNVPEGNGTAIFCYLACQIAGLEFPLNSLVYLEGSAIGEGDLNWLVKVQSEQPVVVYLFHNADLIEAALEVEVYALYGRANRFQVNTNLEVTTIN